MSGDVVERFPDRIWASPKGEYGQGFEAIKLATWSEKREYREGYETEYVRADLITSQAAEIEQLKKEVGRWHSAYEIAHDQAVANGQALAEARAALEWSARLFDGIRSAVETNQVVDKDVHGTAISGRDAARTAARTLTNGGENGR